MPTAVKILLISAIAIAVEAICIFIDSKFFIEFLKDKIIEILITLMAINTATSTFLVAKLNDIAKENKTNFRDTYREIRLSLAEQIILIVVAVALLTAANSTVLADYLKGRVGYVLDVALIFVFIYAIDILRDTGVAMFDVLNELENRDSDKN